MSYLLNNQQKFNDVVFEHRNKSYGAYAIRSAYGNTLFKSLAIISFTCATFLSIVVLLSKKEEVIRSLVEQLPPATTTTIVDLTEKQKPAEPRVHRDPPRPDPSKPNTSSFGTTVMDSVPDNRPQLQNQELASNTTATAAATESGTGNGSVTDATDNGLKADNSEAGDDIAEPYAVDKEPEFEGGLKALYRFLATHLRYPELAADRGKEGTLYVKFVVDEKGKVGNLVLRNNLGFGLDEEALRVVSLIPNFKAPATMKGKPVKVYYQVPITFRMR